MSDDDEAFRQAYSAAARAFLLKDHEGALDSLTELQDLSHSLVVVDGPSESFESVRQDSPPSSPELDLLRPPSPSDALRRKALVLRITVLANVCSEPDLEPLLRSRQEYSQLAGKPADVVAVHLYNDALALYDSALDASAMTTTSPPLPAPNVSKLPPSVAVALALAALKLGSPLTAKAICEAWFGSIDERLESALELEGMSLTSEAEARGAAAAEGGGDQPGGPLTRSGDLSLSFSFGGTGSSGIEDGESPQRALLRSYERLYDVYVLQVLPKLDEWAEAEEFASMGLRENGGILRPAKVDVTLLYLSYFLFCIYPSYFADFIFNRDRLSWLNFRISRRARHRRSSDRKSDNNAARQRRKRTHSELKAAKAKARRRRPRRDNRAMPHSSSNRSLRLANAELGSPSLPQETLPPRRLLKRHRQHQVEEQ
jgi:hypothetical protein